MNFGNHGRHYLSDFNSTLRTRELSYQLMSKKYPMDTQDMRTEIEEIFLVKKTSFEQKNSRSDRYIILTVPDSMSIDEVLNLGKRISVIEQKHIKQSKDLISRKLHTVLRCIDENVVAKKAHEILTDLRYNTENMPKSINTLLNKHLGWFNKKILSNSDTIREVGDQLSVVNDIRIVSKVKSGAITKSDEIIIRNQDENNQRKYV